MSILRWATKEAWDAYETASNIDTVSYPGYLCNLLMSDYFDGDDINQDRWIIQSTNVAYTCSNGLFISPIDDDALFQLQTNYLIPQMFDINIKIENYNNSYLYFGFKKDNSNKVELIIDHNNLSLYNNDVLISEQAISSDFSLILTRYSKKIAILLKIDNEITELGIITPTFWDAPLYIKFQPHSEEETLTIKHVEISGYNNGFSYEIGEGRYLSNGVVDDDFNDSFLDIKWQTSNTGNIIETNSGVILQNGGYIYQMLDFLEIPRDGLGYFTQSIKFNAINNFMHSYIYKLETANMYCGYKITFVNNNIYIYILNTSNNQENWTLVKTTEHTQTSNFVNIFRKGNYVYFYINNIEIFNTTFGNIDNYYPYKIILSNIGTDTSIVYNFHIFPLIHRNGTISFNTYNSQMWEVQSPVFIPFDDSNVFTDDKIILKYEGRSNFNKTPYRFCVYGGSFTGTKWPTPSGIYGTNFLVHLDGSYLSSSSSCCTIEWCLGPSSANKTGFTIYLFRYNITINQQQTPVRKIGLGVYENGTQIFYTTNLITLYTSNDDYYISIRAGRQNNPQKPHFIGVTIADQNNNNIITQDFDVSMYDDNFSLYDIIFYTNAQSGYYNQIEISDLSVYNNYTMQFDEIPYSGSFITIEPQDRGNMFLPSTAIYKFKSYTIPTKFSSVYTKGVDDLVYILFSSDGTTWYGPYGKYEDTTDNFYTSSSEIFYLPKSETDEYYYAVHMIPAEYSDSLFFTSFSKYLSLALKLNNNIDFSKYMRINEQTPIRVAYSKYFRLKTPLDLCVNYSTYDRKNLYFEITTSDKYLWLSNIELEDNIIQTYTINKGNANIVGVYGDFVGTLIATVGNIDYLVSPNCFFMMETIDANEIKLTAIGKLTINHLGVFAIWD